MNKEIKEILDNIKNKFEDYYVQDIVSGNDLKHLLDYITNLQNTIKDHEDTIIDKKECIYVLETTITTLQEEKQCIECDVNNAYVWLNDYKSRMDKAIEYIEEHLKTHIDYEDYVECSQEEKYELLNILKGSDSNG